MENIQIMTKKILSSGKDINFINDLLKFTIEGQNDKIKSAAINDLRKIFKYFILQKKLVQFSDPFSLDLAKKNNDQLQDYATFIHKKFNALIEILKGYILSDLKMSSLQELSIKVYLEFARYHLESCLNDEERNEFTTSILFKDYFHFSLQAYQLNLPSKNIFKKINEEYFCNYYDFAYLELLQLLINFNKSEQLDEKDKNYLIFCKLPSLKSVDCENYFFNVFKKQHDENLLGKRKFEPLNQGKKIETLNQNNGKKEEIDKNKLALVQEKRNQLMNVYSQIVIRLMKFAQNSENFKLKLLEKMNKNFFNNMESPLLLSDFLTSEFNSSQNPHIKIMALKAIFLLIINHSFEYPNYYQKLYSLLKLESNIYESKHLFTFFNLLDVSLRSNKISAKTISAFIKRMLRTSLFLDPPKILWYLYFCINLIKKNPILLQMVNKKNKTDFRVLDVFNNEEEDFTKSNSFSSELWELESLKNHYCGDIAKLLKVFEGDMEEIDFLDLDNFMKIEYCDLISLKLEKMKKKSNLPAKLDDEIRNTKTLMSEMLSLKRKKIN